MMKLNFKLRECVRENTAAAIAKSLYLECSVTSSQFLLYLMNTYIKYKSAKINKIEFLFSMNLQSSEDEKQRKQLNVKATC